MATGGNMKAYMREQLKHQNYKTIAVESRRNGLKGLIARSDLHSTEVAREQQLTSLTSNSNKFVTIAIDPDTGTFGIYQILKPEGELPFEDTSADVGPTSAESDALAKSEASKLRSAGSTANELANKVINSTIRDYESLVEAIPDGVAQDLVLQQLKQARAPLMEVETIEGLVVLGGYMQLQDSIPCRQRYIVLADVEKTEKGIKHDPSITFVPLKLQPEGCSLPPMFSNHSSICAQITTSDKRTALKFIHFSLFQEIYVKLELELEYQLTTGKWSVKVVGMPEPEKAIVNAKSAQMVFIDW